MIIPSFSSSGNEDKEDFGCIKLYAHSKSLVFKCLNDPCLSPNYQVDDDYHSQIFQ